MLTFTPILDCPSSQDNVFAKEVTLKDMLTFQLGLFDGGPLQIAVSEGTRFINRFNRLSAKVSLPADEIPAGQPEAEDHEGAVLVLHQEDHPARNEQEEGADSTNVHGPADEDHEDAAVHSDEQEQGGSPGAPAEQNEDEEAARPPALTSPAAQDDEAELDGGSTITQQEQDEQAAKEQAFREDYAGFDPDDHARLALPDPINKQQKRAACQALDGEAVDNPAAPGMYRCISAILVLPPQSFGRTPC